MKKKLLAAVGFLALALAMLCTAAGADNGGDEAFPSRYDPRELGLVTSVKDQGNYGTCWAFAIANCMESNALKKGLGEYDLSEYQLAYMCMHIAPEGALITGTEGPECDGDWFEGPYGGIISSSLLKGCALRSEEEFPYSKIEEPLSADGYSEDGVLYVDSCYTILTSDTSAMKAMIYENGAVYMNICARCWSDESGEFCDWSTGAAYFPRFSKKYSRIDHFVSVVGWDDGYSRDNFRTAPPGDGAWIIKNSWGVDYGDEDVFVGDEKLTSVGDNGYFYISYYDAAFNDMNSATAITVTKERDFDRIYQYDLGAGLLYSANTTDVVIRFTASEDESITGVRIKPTGRLNYNYFYCGDWAFEETAARISVYEGAFDTSAADKAKPVYTQEYAILHPDYQTVRFDSEVALKKGEEYYVRVTFDKPIFYALDGPQKLFYSYRNNAGADPGETILKTDNGDGTSEWRDAAEIPGKGGPCSACIKVLTRDGAPSQTETPSGFPVWLVPMIAAVAIGATAAVMTARKKRNSK